MFQGLTFSKGVKASRVSTANFYLQYVNALLLRSREGGASAFAQ